MANTFFDMLLMKNLELAKNKDEHDATREKNNENQN